MDATSGSGKPLILVTVGTDHHPFDRLIHAIDAWMEAGGIHRARCFVQAGTSAPPRIAAHTDYLSYQDLDSMMREAAAVVSHGGPGTIMDCRGRGLVPIVVPRRSGLGEHVDDHQVVFSRRMAELGEIRLAETTPQLHQMLERAVSTPEEFRAPQSSNRPAEAVRRFEELVERMLESPKKRWRLIRAPRRLVSLRSGR